MTQADPGVFIRKDRDREKMDLLLRGELEGMLRRSTEKPLDRVRGPHAGHNIWVSSKSVPNLSVWSKETHTAHVPPQVTTGACLFRSGTYRARRDKVHVICFPEKSAQDRKKQKDFIKRDRSCRGPGMCLPSGHAFPVPGPPMCWGHAGARHLHGGERQERLNT